VDSKAGTSNFILAVLQNAIDIRLPVPRVVLVLDGDNINNIAGTLNLLN